MRSQSWRTAAADHLTLVLTVVCMAFPAVVVAGDALPQEKLQGAIRYRSGGIGQDEVKAMQEVASRYPLQLVFVAREESGHEIYLRVSTSRSWTVRAGA